MWPVATVLGSNVYNGDNSGVHLIYLFIQQILIEYLLWAPTGIVLGKTSWNLQPVRQSDPFNRWTNKITTVYSY